MERLYRIKQAIGEWQRYDKPKLRYHNIVKSFYKPGYVLIEVPKGATDHYLPNRDEVFYPNIPGSKVHGANMGPIWCRQDPGGPHVGPMNLAIWDVEVGRCRHTERVSIIMNHQDIFLCTLKEN